MSKQQSKHGRTHSSRSDTPDSGGHKTKRQHSGKRSAQQQGDDDATTVTTGVGGLSLQSTAGSSTAGYQQTMGYQFGDPAQGSSYAQGYQVGGPAQGSAYVHGYKTTATDQQHASESSTISRPPSSPLYTGKGNFRCYDCTGLPEEVAALIVFETLEKLLYVFESR